MCSVQKYSRPLIMICLFVSSNLAPPGPADHNWAVTLRMPDVYRSRNQHFCFTNGPHKQLGGDVDLQRRPTVVFWGPVLIPNLLGNQTSPPFSALKSNGK